MRYLTGVFNVIPLKIWIALLLFIIQGLPIMGWFYDHGVAPNLLVLYLILLAFYDGIAAGLLWGLLFGLLIDLSSGIHFINTIILPVLGLGIGVFKNDIFRGDPIIAVLVAAVGTAVWTGGYYFFAIVVFNEPMFFHPGKVLFLILLHGLITPLLARIFSIRFQT
ncbi:MAG: hypothetical protein ABIH39_07865 [Candidatus Margulisiibacteriota bacterium]